MSKLVKERERGSLIVISGPSGCGKGTVIDGYLRTNSYLFLVQVER